MKKYFLLLLSLYLISCNKDNTDEIKQIYKFSELEIKQLDSLDSYCKILYSKSNVKCDTFDLSISYAFMSTQGVIERSNTDVVLMLYGIIRSSYSIYFYNHISIDEVDTLRNSIININDFVNFFYTDNWCQFDKEKLNSCEAFVNFQFDHQQMTYCYKDEFDSQIQFKLYDVKIRNESSVILYGRLSGKLHNVIGEEIVLEDAIFKDFVHI